MPRSPDDDASAAATGDGRQRRVAPRAESAARRSLVRATRCAGAAVEAAAPWAGARLHPHRQLARTVVTRLPSRPDSSPRQALGQRPRWHSPSAARLRQKDSATAIEQAIGADHQDCVGASIFNQRPEGARPENRVVQNLGIRRVGVPHLARHRSFSLAVRRNAHALATTELCTQSQRPATA